MIESTPRRGRPRNEATRTAILEAAFLVLAERGYAGMSIEAVAERSRSAKTTIYRGWKNKADLAVSAFFHTTQTGLQIPDTGSTREDFRLQIEALATLLHGARGAVFAAMLGGARIDPELAHSLGERWLEPRRAWGVQRMRQALAQGECHPGIDIQAALGILYGPLYTPLLFGQDVPSATQVASHLAIALPAIFR